VFAENSPRRWHLAVIDDKLFTVGQEYRLGSIADAFIVVSPGCGVTRQRGDNRISRLNHDSSLAWARLNQTEVDQPPYGVADNVPGRAVMFPQLKFGR
jgi:hypothetical protein